MLYMIYSEWDEDNGCIINFIEGKDCAIIWAKHFFNQYYDSIPRYIDFHWQEIKPKLTYTRDREFCFHPKPVFCFSNGFGSVIVVPVDHEISSSEFMQIPEFDGSIFPWSDMIDAHLEYQYLKRLIENN